MKRITALILAVIIVVNTVVLTTNRAYATEVIAGSAISEVVALILSACGTGFTAYLADQGFTDLTREEMVTVLTTHFAIKVIGGKYRIESKETGAVYTPTIDVDWDLLNDTMNDINNSTGGKIIAYMDGDLGVSLSLDMKVFLQWWKANVRLEGSNYKVLTHVTSMGYTYDKWVSCNKQQMLTYIPVAYRDEYVIMTNELRNISTKASSSFINSQVGLETVDNRTEYESIGDIDFVNPTNNYAFTQYDAYISFYDQNPNYAGSKYVQVIIYYDNPKIYNGGLKYTDKGTYKTVYISDSTVTKAVMYRRFVYWETGQETVSIQGTGRDQFVPWGVLTNYNVNAWQILSSSHDLYDLHNTLILEGDTESTIGTAVAPSIIVPAIVMSETGTAVLGFDDVVDLPVEEDEDGVPYVPDTVPELTGDEVFDGVAEGETGLGADATTNEWLAEISGEVGQIKNQMQNQQNEKNQMMGGFDDLYELIKSKLGLFFQLMDFLESIANASVDPQRPTIAITFNGQFGIYGTYQIVDLDYYEQYRGYVQMFIASVAWIVFIKRTFKKIPDMITT